MEWKIWGTRELVFKANCVEVYHLKLRPDPDTGAPISCSWHKHAMKHNLLYVLCGSLITETRDGGETERLRCGIGEYGGAGPGIAHRFIVTERAEIIEVTWAGSITEDIDREDEGHVLNDWPGHGGEGAS